MRTPPGQPGVIGGTLASVLLGLNPYRTPVDGCQEFWGESDPVEENEAMRMGKVLEPVVLDQYEHKTGLAVQRECDDLTHPELPWLVGHPDGIVVRGSRLVEAKTGQLRTAEQEAQWGDEGTGDIPEHFRVQVYLYLALSKLPVADVAALHNGQQFRVYTVERDTRIQDALIDKLAEFKATYLDTHTLPPLQDGDAAKVFTTTDPGKVHDADEGLANMLTAYHQLKSSIGAADKEAKKLRESILAEVQDADTIQYRGERLATFKLSKGGEVSYTKKDSRQLRVCKALKEMATTEVQTT